MVFYKSTSVYKPGNIRAEVGARTGAKVEV